MKRAPRASLVTIAKSGTPLDAEYRSVDVALRRVEPLVASFDASLYDARAIGAAQRAWRERMGAEHRSTTVFSGLAAQLVEANASLDAKAVMLRMAIDELRHTEMCADVVTALGGSPTADVELRVEPLARHRGCSAEERALRNVIYTTCLSEMVAVARLVDEHASTRDPYLRDAARKLLADEVLHGQFGFLYLEAWRPWLEARADVRASIRTYLQHAFAILEEELGGAPARARLSDDERALGLPDGARGREIFYDTIENAVVPGLDRFDLGAARAWKKRRRLT